MEDGRYTYIEKQYIGRDYVRISIRLMMAAFCFGIYVYERDRDNTVDLFLIVGFGILAVSILLLFLVQFKTVVEDKKVTLSGLWTAKKVVVDLNEITDVRKSMYSKFIFNNPVYNLHKNGTIRFYSSGRDAIVLVHKSGLEYYIGTQRPNEMYLVIKNEIKAL
jgi:hypothetical protein